MYLKNIKTTYIKFFLIFLVFYIFNNLFWIYASRRPCCHNNVFEIMADAQYILNLQESFFNLIVFIVALLASALMILILKIKNKFKMYAMIMILLLVYCFFYLVIMSNFLIIQDFHAGGVYGELPFLLM
jgi:hypothetical protein